MSMSSHAEVLVSPDLSLGATLAKMNQTGNRIVFVESGGGLVGAVSDGDARRALLEGATMQTPASEVMNRDFISVPSGTQPATVAAYFGRGISALPVLDETGALVDVLFEPIRSVIPLAEPEITPREVQYVNECLRTGWISSAGRFVTEFENSFRTFTGSHSAITVSNGTTAIVLALKALGVGPGDEVIVPDLTFGATANAVVQAGATPVLVDVEPDSWCLSAATARQGLTARTKAVIPVHLYGYPAPIAELSALAHEHGLFIVEDCAEAIGTYEGGHHVGTRSDAGVFSFYANKTVTTGEGGMLLFRDPDVADRARIMRSHGFSPKKRYWHEEWGTNFRMTNLQAAVGVAQMERVQRTLERKRDIAARYTKLLDPLCAHGLELPGEPGSGVHSHWLYTVLLPKDVDPEQVLDEMMSHGIECRRMFYPLHEQPAFSSFSPEGARFPNSRALSARGISLPSWPMLRPEDQEQVVAALEASIDAHRRLATASPTQAQSD